MEVMFTPWRYEYVKTVDQQEGCIFCDKPSDPESKDEENLILVRKERCFVILNLYPYSSAHLMVVPYEHTGTIEDLDAETMGEMMALTQQCMRAIREAYTPDGFNVGINISRVAGAGIDGHVHLHLVPRWDGDSNFMPVVAGVRVLPLALDSVWRTLKDLL
ncbi:MAG: HIT domain-containing protein [Actinobacteria bacterium]|nr:HIT domain-containing protein [Actinomycetota bacterium]MCG2795550.1 HIT domain-containing protein [Actinomycetes bacterium]MBU4241478.1 HIT domain-containing protein [Actinomycetota bacterium]MBU4302519.1 HIT domain-containing protein [Actinomycetota bacterium]MBU4386076.1 HIT domain-containing protein [Actinomycetota bacterium]